MLPLLLGALILFLLLGGMRAFEQASIRSAKLLLAWVVALGGLSLAAMLILTGRGGAALSALLLVGPLVWQKFQATHRPVGGRGRRTAGPRSTDRAMSRQEAYEVLGLRPGATEAEIRDAHRRLMRGAHPDAGGSDWLAARINQARDILLG
ncbi:MAG TPA: DnaJ domain-containing protein [Rhodopila sp.]|nr:DnaJ domain-containing protein [Rhodopila sp.]